MARERLRAPTVFAFSSQEAVAALGLRILRHELSSPHVSFPAIALHLVAMRAAFVYERRRPTLQAVEDDESRTTLAVAGAAVVVACGVWQPFIGIEIADVMGSRTTLIGTLFIAGATPLPESSSP